MYKQATALKGLAVFLVVINHTIVMGTAGLDRLQISLPSQLQVVLNLLATLGLYTVPIFLFFSGAYANYALENRGLRAGYKIIFTYILNALWPYLIWSSVFYLLIFLDGGKTFTLLGYLKNFLVGYPFNFVPLLMFFYLITPLLKKVKGPLVFVILGLFFLYQVYMIFLSDPDLAGSIPESLHVLSIPIIHEPLRFWAIYYPLGIFIRVFTTLSGAWKKILQFTFLSLAVLALALSVISILGVFNSPWTKYLQPLPLVLFSIYWQREKVPFFKFFERLGRRSYGLYLLNLIILDILVLLEITLFDRYFNFFLVLLLILFVATLFVGVFVMEGLEKVTSKRYYRIIFG